MISYEEYYPYGSTAYSSSSSSADLSLKRYRFTGKERDEETGLDYFGVRYYASWLGRWTSGDPGGFVDGLNLYRYVRNNPVNGVDNLGYETDPPPTELKGATSNNNYDWTPANPDQFVAPVDKTRVDYTYNGYVQPLAMDGEDNIWTINMTSLEVTPDWDLRTAVWGAIRFSGGVFQGFMGSVGVLVPEPITSVVGGVALYKGVDDMQTGLRQMWYGYEQKSLTEKIGETYALSRGATQEEAVLKGKLLDFGLSLATPNPNIILKAPQLLNSSNKAVTFAISGSKVHIADASNLFTKLGSTPYHYMKDDSIPPDGLDDVPRMPIDEKRVKHIFRDAIGHVPDTPKNRELFETVAGNNANKLGSDKYNNVWYAKMLANGKQVWTETRNGKITNAGINNVPKIYNAETGLKQQ